jgi:cell division protein FtsI (penicillin-binding protein 3)
MLSHTDLKFRITCIFILFLVLYALIIVNLYSIQIRNNNFYTRLGVQQYYGLHTHAPTRGLIYDRKGTLLALNQDCLSAFVLPKQLKERDATLSFLQQHFPQAYQQLKTKTDKQFLYVKRHLSESQEKLIATQGTRDIQLLHEPHRFYPVSAAAPVVGSIDIDGNGIIGTELQYNRQLAGVPTTYYLEKDARSGNYYFEKHDQVDGKEATNIHLTIDANLQFLIHETVKTTVQKFNALEGYALVMNPATGEIIAMVTYPHFDPNDSAITDVSQTKNKIVTEAFELGSVIKTFAALAALQEGVVTPDELIDCKNSKTAYIDGRKINTPHAHGILPFTDVVGLSNNIGTAIVAKRVGTRMYDYYTRLGFGTKTGIHFPGEHAGFVNHPDNWSKQSIISLSYGYEITATILQLGCALCEIANDGYPITPLLCLHDIQPTTRPSKPLYDRQALETIKSILEHTTAHGTAKHAQINGYRIMSKTGTAILLTDGVYDEKKNIFTCSGIIEKGDYKRVIVTFINQAQGTRLFASTVAVPLFEKVAQHVLINDRIV